MARPEDAPEKWEEMGDVMSGEANHLSETDGTMLEELSEDRSRSGIKPRSTIGSPRTGLPGVMKPRRITGAAPTTYKREEKVTEKKKDQRPISWSS